MSAPLIQGLGLRRSGRFSKDQHAHRAEHSRVLGGTRRGRSQLVPSRRELRAGEDARVSKEQRASRPNVACRPLLEFVRSGNERRFGETPFPPEHPELGCPVRVYFTALPLDPGKTVRFITSPTNGNLHVFAMAIG